MKLFAPLLLLLLACGLAAPLAAQSPKPHEALTKAGLNEKEIWLLEEQLGLIKGLSGKIADSTAIYEELAVASQAYQTIAKLLQERKIRPATLLAALPESQTLMSQGKAAKQKAEWLEAKDQKVRFKKSVAQLEGYLIEAGFAGKSKEGASVETMLGTFAKRMEEKRKQRTQNESYLRDLIATTTELASLYKTLKANPDAEYNTSQEYAAAIKRLRINDLHRDEEFVQNVGYKLLIEQLIQTGEILIATY